MENATKIYLDQTVSGLEERAQRVEERTQILAAQTHTANDQRKGVDEFLGV